MAPNVAQGSCLCGQLVYEIVMPTKWAGHCHCSMCRRAHGAAFVTWVGVADWNFRLVRGAEHLSWHRSSPEARRGFCNQCGSPLFFRSQRWQGETHVTYASLTSPIDRTPGAHVCWDTHVDWVALADDGLPRKTAAELLK